MTPADLARYGQLLTGSATRWRRPLAELLGVSESFIRQMMLPAADDRWRPVPERIAARLRELASERRQELESLR